MSDAAKPATDPTASPLVIGRNKKIPWRHPNPRRWLRDRWVTELTAIFKALATASSSAASDWAGAAGMKSASAASAADDWSMAAGRKPVCESVGRLLSATIHYSSAIRDIFPRTTTYQLTSDGSRITDQLLPGALPPRQPRPLLYLIASYAVNGSDFAVRHIPRVAPITAYNSEWGVLARRNRLSSHDVETAALAFAANATPSPTGGGAADTKSDTASASVDLKAQSTTTTTTATPTGTGTGSGGPKSQTRFERLRVSPLITYIERGWISKVQRVLERGIETLTPAVLAAAVSGGTHTIINYVWACFTELDWSRFEREWIESCAVAGRDPYQVVEETAAYASSASDRFRWTPARVVDMIHTIWNAVRRFTLTRMKRLHRMIAIDGRAPLLFRTAMQHFGIVSLRRDSVPPPLSMSSIWSGGVWHTRGPHTLYEHHHTTSHKLLHVLFSKFKCEGAFAADLEYFLRTPIWFCRCQTNTHQPRCTVCGIDEFDGGGRTVLWYAAESASHGLIDTTAVSVLMAAGADANKTHPTTLESAFHGSLNNSVRSHPQLGPKTIELLLRGHPRYPERAADPNSLLVRHIAPNDSSSALPELRRKVVVPTDLSIPDAFGPSGDANPPPYSSETLWDANQIVRKSALQLVVLGNHISWPMAYTWRRSAQLPFAPTSLQPMWSLIELLVAYGADVHDPVWWNCVLLPDSKQSLPAAGPTDVVVKTPPALSGDWSEQKKASTAAVRFLHAGLRYRSLHQFVTELEPIFAADKLAFDGKFVLRAYRSGLNRYRLNQVSLAEQIRTTVGANSGAERLFTINGLRELITQYLF